MAGDKPLAGWHCFTVHGYNVSDGGRATTDVAVPLLRQLGARVTEIDYGHTTLATVDEASRCAAEHLAARSLSAQAMDRKTLCLGHSNGARICWLAAERYGGMFNATFVVNPALRVLTTWPEASGRVVCWHSRGDEVVLLPYLVHFLLRFRVVRQWGAAGRYGFLRGATNIEMQRTFGFQEINHSDAFKRPEVRARFLESMAAEAATVARTARAR